MEGLTPCIKLHTFLCSNNRIKSWDEIGKLGQLQEIKSVNFINNPVYGDRSREENAPFVVKKIPQLDTIDSATVTAKIRKDAESLD